MAAQGCRFQRALRGRGGNMDCSQDSSDIAAVAEMENVSSQSGGVGTASFINHGKGIKWKFHFKPVCCFLRSIFGNTIFFCHKTTDCVHCGIVLLVFPVKSIELRSVDAPQD